MGLNLGFLIFILGLFFYGGECTKFKEIRVCWVLGVFRSLVGRVRISWDIRVKFVIFWVGFIFRNYVFLVLGLEVCIFNKF